MVRSSWGMFGVWRSPYEKNVTVAALHSNPGNVPSGEMAGAALGMTDFMAVDSDNFWSIIDGARSAAGERVTPGFAGRFTAALRMRLANLDKSELLDFDAHRTR